MEIADTLNEQLAKVHCACSVVPIRHLSDLRIEIQKRFDEGLFDGDFYRERLASFDYDSISRFPRAESIIVTAAPQPKQRVTFHVSGERYFAIVPPTYSAETDGIVRHVLSDTLETEGYALYDVKLPEKLLAVLSGLARYGKNNIAYVAPWGSYVRFKIFMSDMPCGPDPWQGFQTLERCQSCRACQKSCPTGAIDPDRFLIHAERCLTFLNEKPGGVRFPDWVKSEWHHCLVGCMTCQDVCPENMKVRDWIEKSESFSEEETAVILAGEPRESLHPKMRQKLKRLFLYEDYDILSRNLSALIQKA